MRIGKTKRRKPTHIKLIFVAFFGKDKSKSKHMAHESSWNMTLPLILLAILSVVVGLVNSPWFYDMFGKSFSTFIYFKEAEIPKVDMTVAGTSTIVALAGIFFSWLIYSKKVINTTKLAERYSGLYRLVLNKYYIDEFYDWIFVNVMLLGGKAFNAVDHYVIDGIFDNFARLINYTGRKLRLTQSGALQSYALVIFTAVVFIVIAMSAFTPILGGVFK